MGGEMMRYAPDNSRPGDPLGEIMEDYPRATWIPHQKWWQALQREHNLPNNADGAATREVVEKAIRGERLGSTQRGHLQGLLDEIESWGPDVRLEGFDPTVDTWADAHAAAGEAGLNSRIDALDTVLVEHASRADEDAVERAALRYEDDHAGFMDEVRRIIDESQEPDRVRENPRTEADARRAPAAPEESRPRAPDAAGEGRFSRAAEGRDDGPGRPRIPLTAAETRRAARTFLGDWRTPVETVERVADLPESLRAPPDARGAYDPATGKVWLVAENLGAEDVGRVILHELVGHKGLRALMPEAALRRFVDLVETHPELAARAKALRDADPGLTREHALEEAFAERAEALDGAEPTGRFRELYNRAAAMVREGLRRLGVKVRLSDAEVADVLARSRRAVAEGRADGEGARFSRAGSAAAAAPSGAAAPRRSPGDFVAEYARTGRLPGGEESFERVGGAVRNQLGKVGLANRFPKAFSENLRLSAATTARAKRIVNDEAKVLAKLTPQDRALVSDVIEGEVAHGVTPGPAVKEAAQRLVDLFTEQSDELLRLGMISPETHARLKGAYLPRFYEKHAAGLSKKDPIWASFQREYIEGVDGRHLKGRGLFKWVDKADVAAYEGEGWATREVPGALKRTEADKGKVMMWRDWTRAEREQMGEYRDAGARFVMGYLRTQRDIAIGRMMEATATNPELASADPRADWVKVPDSEVAGTPGVKRYGLLAGKYVHPDVYAHLKYLVEPKGSLEKSYMRALTAWKVGKTALNPVSHFNNTMGNLMMLDLSGTHPVLNARTLYRVLKDFRAETGYYKEAQDNGLLDTTFSAQELGELLPPGLKSDMPLEAMATTWFGHRWEQMKAMAAKIPVLGKYNAAMKRLYAAEDAYFKLVAYSRAREAGMSQKDAAEHTERYFFNYADLPVNVRRYRDFWSPFISYTYKAGPAVMHAAFTQPHKIAVWMALLGGANAYGYSRIFGDGQNPDEDDERKKLPEHLQARNIFGLPSAVRLRGMPGEIPRFLETQNFVPLGDILSARNTMGGVPLPTPLMPSHPLFATIEAMLANRDTFTGKDIVKKSMTPWQAAEARSGVLVRQALPNVPFFPGSYSWNKLANGLAGDMGVTVPYAGIPDDADGVDYRGRKMSLSGADGAVARSLGLKVTPVDLDQQRSSMRRKALSDIEEAEADFKHIRKSHPTPRELERARAELDEKRAQARKRLAEIG